jgi:hypothetical protein
LAAWVLGRSAVSKAMPSSVRGWVVVEQGEHVRGVGLDERGGVDLDVLAVARGA